MKWNFEAQLLAPLNNAVRTSYPYFNWAPIPAGALRDPNRREHVIRRADRQ